MKLIKLRGTGLRRGIGQQAGGPLGLGEGDDVANGLAAAEHAENAVQPEGDPAVGRRAGFQS